MKTTIKKIKEVQPKKASAFSKFFRNTSPSQQSKVIRKVIREANKDQRKLMDEAVKLSA